MIVRADVRRGLPLKSKSVHMICTSPPYWALRDYGDPRQIGLEPTPQAYVERMVGVFRECRRVLRDDGTLWLNIGDSYANDAKGPNDLGKSTLTGDAGYQRTANPPGLQRAWRGGALKKKDLIGIPWMLAFALRDDGWYLRSEIIWNKPNPMPESVVDRPSKCHEQVFLLTKSPSYYYDLDAIREPMAEGSEGRYAYAFGGGKNESLAEADKEGMGVRTRPIGFREPTDGRNSRTVWTIPTRPFKGGHFAVMAVDLAERCIKAGTSEKGVCPHCSAPHVRVTESERVATRPGVASKVYSAAPLDADSPYQTHSGDICGNRDPKRHVTKSRTTGWRPSCPCPSSDPIPATVFDPFGGAMTTILAARRLGRVGISTELSAEYAAIGQARLRGSMYDISGAGMNDDYPLFAEGSLF